MGRVEGGCSSGIGRDLAGRLIQSGYRVVATVEAFGRIDVLVNNAGYVQFGAIEELSDVDFHRQFEVNLHGPVRLIRAVAPHMRRQGAGRIINVSSDAGGFSAPVQDAYAATKFAQGRR